MVPGWHPRAASRKTACTCPMNGQCIYLAHVPVDVCESFFCACTSISGYLDKILIRIWPLYVILAAYLFRPFLQLFGNIFRHGNPRLHVLEAKGFTNLHHLHQNRNCLHNHGPPFTLFRRCRNYGHIMCAHAHAASSRQWPKGKGVLWSRLRRQGLTFIILISSTEKCHWLERGSRWRRILIRLSSKNGWESLRVVKIIHARLCGAAIQFEGRYIDWEVPQISMDYTIDFSHEPAHNYCTRFLMCHMAFAMIPPKDTMSFHPKMLSGSFP